MFKTTTKSLLIIASLALALPLSATETNTTNEVSKTILDTSLSMAHELLQTMNMEKTYTGMIDKVTEMQLHQNPKLKAIEPTIHAFFMKYMGWGALKEDMAKMYAKSYTEEEIKELIAFYKTKVGEKTLKLMPKLAITGTAIAKTKLSEHIGELKTMVDAELKKMSEVKSKD
jgi:hypothetical protein